MLIRNRLGNDCVVSMDKREHFVSTVLEWEKVNTRDFPWRRTKDAYRILIAEIMLQRTKAKQVVPVYKQFIKSFPNVHSLAKASVFKIKEEIHSLGLEKRAQGLKRLAKQLVVKYKVEIPKNRDELMKLPWIGNYTANALLCHAFEADVPTVDSNFARVLDRVFSLKPKHPAQKDKRIWAFAQSLMPLVKGDSYRLNLAIIDLASKICRPKKPSCSECPLNSICNYSIIVLSCMQ